MTGNVDVEIYETFINPKLILFGKRYIACILSYQKYNPECVLNSLVSGNNHDLNHGKNLKGKNQNISGWLFYIPTKDRW